MLKKLTLLTAILLLISGGPKLRAQPSLTPSISTIQNDIFNVNDGVGSNRGAIVISDTLKGWRYDWIGNLNGSQAAYNNWSQGGVNTISVTGSTVFRALHRHGQFGYGFSTNLKYGKARIANEGTRKTDDRIEILNKFVYRFPNENWNGFANINFRTQFDQGFDYNVADDKDPILLSEFLAPAYFTQIAGVGYTPNNFFTAEAGLALKETIVSNDSLSTQYGLSAGDNFRFEPGYSVQLGFEKEVLKNVKVVSTLETFTNLQRHIDRTDVMFSNELIGKINPFLNMSFQFVSIYDDDYNSQLQVKQVLSAGLSVSLI